MAAQGLASLEELYELSDSLQSQTGRERSKESDSEHSEPSLAWRGRGNERLRQAVRAVFGTLLFLAVLGCVTCSKLTLVALTDNLRNMAIDKTKKELEERSADIARVYWQLVFILVLPHCLTFVQSAVVGVIGKTKRVHPWPRKSALIVGVISSVVEVVAMSVFVFSVLCYLTPELALLSVQPVFTAQFALDMCLTPPTSKYRNQRQGHPSKSDDPDTKQRLLHGRNDEEYREKALLGKCHSRVRRIFGVILGNRLMKAAALLLQVVGTGGLLAILILGSKSNADYLVPMIALPLSVATLTCLWSSRFQEFLLVPERESAPAPENDSGIVRNARYKANFLNSLYRILLYPLMAYVVFRTIHHGKDIDPWQGSMHHFLGTGSDVSLCLAHILTSFFGYVFAWAACLMTLQTIGFAIPLICSTPVAILVRLGVTFFGRASHGHLLWTHTSFSAALGLWITICLGQVGYALGVAYFLSAKNNLIVRHDRGMFLNPHYESVFLEPYLTLNRQMDTESYRRLSQSSLSRQYPTPHAVFICSTMYQENVREMRQMLASIKRISEWYDKQEGHKESIFYELVESHIFFDSAIVGSQLSYHALQLLSLVSDWLGVEVGKCLCKETPYGKSMCWKVGFRAMRVMVHFKDNSKVKNRKRWSQVMYMNYVINHRIPESRKTTIPLDKDNTFILTTDADVDFSARSAVVLLNSLASKMEVGAVCARTHPKGSGALYWYQVFDYAIEHWLIKPAEQVFGSVLCCPGCFSAFRCRALEGVLKDYSSEVEGAADFLTKDMGEDRWLCTLLVQKGWRLDYCAISDDHTYCPESFDEFYRQRRRWVTSAIANLLLMISRAGKTTSSNNSISILFIVFQAVMAFSTAISPTTVILIMSSGLQGAYQISDSGMLVTVVILSFVGILYGVICLYTTQRTQITLAKFLTFFFATIMSIALVGIFKQAILEVFPPTCGSESKDCTEQDKTVQLPVSLATWYVALFATTYLVTALCHLREIACLFHGLWYMLCLPSGYLLLLIYSAVNLHRQSWGTRETASSKPAGNTGVEIVKWWLREGVKGACECVWSCCGKKTLEESKLKVLHLQNGSMSGLEDEELGKGWQQETDEPYPPVAVEHRKMSESAMQWLKDQECLEYVSNFEENGYWTLSYIASMRREEFKAIGIEKRGFVLRLEKEAMKLPEMVIDKEVPLTEWLRTLEMEEYTKVFHMAGYKTASDVENLKEIDEREFRRMGITKIAHVLRFKKALGSLFHPTADEIKIHQTKRYLKDLPTLSFRDDESTFWEGLLRNELRPVTTHLQHTSKEDIGQKLKTLRNSTLTVFLLINIMWIILLFTVKLPQLKSYKLPEKAFQLLFLAVYGFIVLVSFLAMLVHRFLMLVQFLG